MKNKDLSLLKKALLEGKIEIQKKESIKEKPQDIIVKEVYNKETIHIENPYNDTKLLDKIESLNEIVTDVKRDSFSNKRYAENLVKKIEDNKFIYEQNLLLKVNDTKKYIDEFIKTLIDENKQISEEQFEEVKKLINIDISNEINSINEKYNKSIQLITNRAKINLLESQTLRESQNNSTVNIKKDLNKLYIKTKENINEIESINNNLKKDFQNVFSLMENNNNQIDSLKSILSNDKSQFNAFKTKIIKDVENNNEALNDCLKRVTKNVDEKFNNINDYFKKEQKNINNRFEILKTAVINNLISKIDKNSNEINEKFEQNNNKIEKLDLKVVNVVDGINEKINKTISKLDDKIIKGVVGLNDKFTTEIQLNNTLIKNNKKDFNNIIKEMKIKLDNVNKNQLFINEKQEQDNKLFREKILNVDLKILEKSNDYQETSAKRFNKTTYTHSFVNKDLNNGKIIIHHNLDEKFVITQLYDNMGVQIQPNKLKILDENKLELDVSNYSKIVNVYNLKVVSMIATNNKFLKSFSNDDLNFGSINIVHNLKSQFPITKLYDNVGNEISPDSIQIVNATTINLDISSYGTIVGLYNLVMFS